MFSYSRRSRKESVRASGRKPTAEGLEDRRLPASGLPNIAMLSATTVDSQSVTINYDVENAPITQPMHVQVFRSASSTLDANAVQVGPELVVSPGSATISATLDAAGQPAESLGRHHVTLTLPGGLPPNPRHPYVVVVADPGNASAESNEADNSASFRTHVIGVITHGGVQPKKWAAGPPWERKMAAQLTADGYDTVIPFNWVLDSNNPGAAARQATRLAEEVLQAARQFPPADPVDVHFIGHSEGAVVNSQAILLLNQAGWTPGLNAGYLKVTMLDPHAANTGVPGQQYSVSNGVLGRVAKMYIDHFQSRAKDPAPVVTSNVDTAEVFYQHTPVSQTHVSNRGIYNLWGQVPVRGAANYYDLTAPGISHAGKFGVQDWYRLNVVPTLGDGGAAIDALALTGAPVTSGSTPSHAAEYAGRAAPGATVRLYAAPQGTATLSPIGRTTATADGSWDVTTRPLAAGVYRVVAASNVPAASTSRTIHVRPTAWLGTVSME